jgi:hypothetical protein
LYNGKPASAYVIGDSDWVSMATGTTSYSMQPGQGANIEITLNNAHGDWVSGMTVEIMLHTTGGKDYPKVVTIP